MTIESSIIAASGFFTVGEGAGESAQWPVMDFFREEIEPVATAETSLKRFVRRRWSLRTFGVAAAPQTQYTIRQNAELLAVVGQRVSVRLAAGAGVRELSAPTAGVGASQAGYPRVTVTVNDQLTVGPVVWFDIVAEAIEPIVGAAGPPGFNLVEDDFSLDETVAADLTVSTKRTGTLRVKFGQSARAYADQVIIAPARAAAEAVGDSFTARFTQGLDASVVRYEFTRGAQPGAGFSGVTDSEVNDTTTQQRSGRVVRVIVGSAKGVSATAFAQSREIVQTSTLLRTAKRISAPRVTDSRVEFNYEYIAGVAHPSFVAGASIVRYSESIESEPGDRAVRVSRYTDAQPVLVRGELAEHVVRQTNTVEFFGATAAQAAASVLMDAALSVDNLASAPRISSSVSAEGVTSVTISRLYAFAAAPAAIPEPRRVEVIA